MSMSNNSKDNNNSEQYTINPDTYHLTYHAMKTLFKVFNLDIHTQGENTSWLNSDIFLFDHISRFEALIP